MNPYVFNMLSEGMAKEGALGALAWRGVKALGRGLNFGTTAAAKGVGTTLRGGFNIARRNPGRTAEVGFGSYILGEGLFSHPRVTQRTQSILKPPPPPKVPRP